MCTPSVSLRPEQVACEPFPPQIGSFRLKPFVPWYHPPHPTVSPFLSLIGVVIPSPIVFYLTEWYKCQHILLSGRPFSEHQLRGGLHAEINYRNPTTSCGAFFNFGVLILDSIRGILHQQEQCADMECLSFSRV